MGAFNIALADRVLPPEGWLRIHHISFSYVTVNLNIFMSPPQQELPEIGDRQRMFLSIRWEDGEQEDVDITYKVISIDTLTRTLPQTSARR